MKNQMTRLCFVTILLVAIILASGCTSDNEYTPPSKVESTPSGGETLSETPTATQSEPETQPEQTKTQVLYVFSSSHHNHRSTLHFFGINLKHIFDHKTSIL